MWLRYKHHIKDVVQAKNETAAWQSRLYPASGREKYHKTTMLQSAA
jgi:hypothetical protein